MKVKRPHFGQTKIFVSSLEAFTDSSTLIWKETTAGAADKLYWQFPSGLCNILTWSMTVRRCQIFSLFNLSDRIGTEAQIPDFNSFAQMALENMCDYKGKGKREVSTF